MYIALVNHADKPHTAGKVTLLGFLTESPLSRNQVATNSGAIRTAPKGRRARLEDEGLFSGALRLDDGMTFGEDA